MEELMLGFLLIETRNHIANTKREQFSIKIIYLLSDSAMDVTFTTKLCVRDVLNYDTYRNRIVVLIFAKLGHTDNFVLESSMEN